MNYDIIVIGGGFAGLTAGLAFAGANDDLKVAILEKNDIIKNDKKRDGRTFAISKSSMALFSEFGINDKLEKVAGKITDIRITDGKSPFYLHFDGEEVDDKNPNMGAVIENFHIHNALRDAAVKKKNIDILSPNFYTNIEFDEQSTSVTLDNKKTITAKLLIAADGRISPLRERFEIKTFEKSYNQTAIVFNIKHEKPHHNIAQEKFLPEGPFAVLPMKDSHESSIVWAVKNDMSETIMSLDKENFLDQLMKRTTDYLGKITVTDKPFCYPLNLILADSYYHKRAAFVGDAAHGIHPIAGQGFNVGIQDIRILRDLIKEYFECGLDIGCETLLKKYQKSRKLGAGKMILATDGLNALFSNNILPVKLARDLGLGIVEKFPKLKKFFIRNAGGS